MALPPDPSSNHNIAYGTHNKKTANWFFQGSIFREWNLEVRFFGFTGNVRPVLFFTPYFLMIFEL